MSESSREIDSLFKIIFALLVASFIINFIEGILSLAQGNIGETIVSAIQCVWFIIFAYYTLKRNQALLAWLSFTSAGSLYYMISDFSPYLGRVDPGTILVIYPMLIIRVALVFLPAIVLLKVNKKRIEGLEKNPSLTKTGLRICAILGSIGVAIYFLLFYINKYNPLIYSDNVLKTLFYASPIVIILALYAAKRNSFIGLTIANGAISTIIMIGSGISLEIIRDVPSLRIWEMFDVLSLLLPGMTSLIASVFGLTSILFDPETLKNRYENNLLSKMLSKPK